MAKVPKKRGLRITVDRALGERLSEGVWRKLDRMLVADARLGELLPDKPSGRELQQAKRAPEKRPVGLAVGNVVALQPVGLTVGTEQAAAVTQARSRKPRKNRGRGRQRLRARVVLRRLWSKGYPTEEEVSNADLWDRFVKEFERVEGKEPLTKFNKMPSPDTILREVGRK